MKIQANKYYTITPNREHTKLQKGRYFITRVEWSISLGEMFQVEGDQVIGLVGTVIDETEQLVDVENEEE